jgi:hypothetical protein
MPECFKYSKIVGITETTTRKSPIPKRNYPKRIIIKESGSLNIHEGPRKINELVSIVNPTFNILLLSALTLK